MQASAQAILAKYPDIKLAVVVPVNGSYMKKVCDDITFYMIPTPSLKQYSNKTLKYALQTLLEFKPDIVHCHGTEYSLAYAIGSEAKQLGLPILANIQGLASPYAKYADGALTFKDKISNVTPLDFYRNTFLISQKRNLLKRGKWENKLLKIADAVAGRTRWDQANTLEVNPALKYYFLNETLRDSFYIEKHEAWNILNCNRHSIFVSNSGVALKGAHIMIKALSLIKQKYPDVMLRIVGMDVLSDNWKDRIRFTGYNLYLRRLIKNLHLENNVIFLGNLSELEMKAEYLHANVYVLPSAIENSPNSLCEAQMLGVPSIASYCGGVPTLTHNGDTTPLYRFEEHAMLADLICEEFDKGSDTDKLEQTRQMALKRHSKENNASQLYKIYHSLLTTAENV